MVGEHFTKKIDVNSTYSRPHIWSGNIVLMYGPSIPVRGGRRIITGLVYIGPGKLTDLTYLPIWSLKCSPDFPGSGLGP